MKKTVLIVVCVMLAAALVFSGCAENQQDAASASQPGEAATEASVDASPDAGETTAAGGSYKIGVSLMDYNMQFFQDMLAAMKAKAAELGVELVDFDSQQDAAKQLNDVQDMVNALKVDAIILNPVDSASIAPAVLDANDAKIPVFTVDVAAEGGEVVSHIASSNVEIGKKNAEEAVNFLKEKNGDVKGKVIVVTYDQITSMRDRKTGWTEIMSQYPDVEIIEKSPISITSEDTMTLLEDSLTTYPAGEIDLICPLNSSSTLGVMAAVETANRGGDLKIMGVDEDEDIIAAIKKDDAFVIGTVVQQPVLIGTTAVQAAYDYLQGKTDMEASIATDVMLVTKATMADYEDTVKKSTEYIADYK